MKAIVFKQYGSPDFMSLKELTKPAPGEKEVLIKVHAASINEWDWAILRGVPFVNRLLYGLFKPKMQVLGADLAGIVEAVGTKVTRFKPGDAVFGDLSAAGWGGFAEYTCAPEIALMQKPTGISFIQAASLPQAGLLAVQGLRKGLLQNNRTEQSQKVLINGAGGGVGSIAIQIAKSYGAEVTAVDKSTKLEKMRSLGADHVIDYTKDDFTKSGLCYDLILDVMAAHSLFDGMRVLSRHGRYILLGGASRYISQLMLIGPLLSLFSGKKMSLLIYKPNQDLDKLIDLVEAGTVTPIIDRIYPLSETADAFRYYGTGHCKGKIVIAVQQGETA